MIARFPFCVAVSLSLLAAVAGATADELVPIRPDQARQHVGRLVDVVFEVKASKHSARHNTTYLDSDADFRSPVNLGIAISAKGIDDLKTRRGVDALADFYRGKQIRVTGIVVIEEDRVYLKVDSADQLDLHREPPGKRDLSAKLLRSVRP